MDRTIAEEKRPRGLAARLAPGGILRGLAGFARRKPLGAIGGLLVLLLISTAILADVIAPYGYAELAGKRLTAPSAQQLMGTDNFGRDVFTRVVYGARVSMYVATGAVVTMVLVSTTIGLLSANFGGSFDLVMQRFVDGIMVFPFLVIILTIMALFGGGLLNVALAIGVLSGIGNSRVVRSAALSVKAEPYVEAARALGGSQVRIMAVHLLPNIAAPILVMATLLWGTAILAEAGLSFLGFGVPPPHPSWGGMISGAGRQYLEQAPWIAFFPGLAISIAVFGFNMLGDALRDVWDPRLRGSQR